MEDQKMRRAKILYMTGFILFPIVTLVLPLAIVIPSIWKFGNLFFTILLILFVACFLLMRAGLKVAGYWERPSHPGIKSQQQFPNWLRIVGYVVSAFLFAQIALGIIQALSK